MEPDETVGQRLERMQTEILELRIELFELRHTLIKAGEAILAMYPHYQERPCPMEER